MTKNEIYSFINNLLALVSSDGSVIVGGQSTGQIWFNGRGSLTSQASSLPIDFTNTSKYPFLHFAISNFSLNFCSYLVSISSYWASLTTTGSITYSYPYFLCASACTIKRLFDLLFLLDMVQRRLNALVLIQRYF